jgi:DNA invertase Pin-like site-specific DNA recombinase
VKDAISYVRVSSEEQADSGLGLEAQRQRIAAYCAMKGLHLAETFEDPGVSAGEPLASRPAGSKLLAAAKKGKAVVVVAKLDRLFRSVADAANVIEEFDKRGIKLVAIAENLDMTSPYGRAMAQMASVFAELQRAMIRERTRSAMSVKRSRGERISGHAPYGWDFGRGSLLVENVREQKVIARMRRMQAEGMSYRGIAVRLDAEGIRPSGVSAGYTPRSRASCSEALHRVVLASCRKLAATRTPESHARHNPFPGGNSTSGQWPIDIIGRSVTLRSAATYL